MAGVIWSYFNLLAEFMDRLAHGLRIFHPPGVFAYLLRGQYHIMISHEVQQQGKLTAAQGHRLSIDLRHPAGRVDVNAPNLKGCGLRIYWIVIMIVFGVSPELSADIIGNRCKRGLS